jgi:hypothetical protein
MVLLPQLLLGIVFSAPSPDAPTFHGIQPGYHGITIRPISSENLDGNVMIFPRIDLNYFDNHASLQ